MPGTTNALHERDADRLASLSPSTQRLYRVLCTKTPRELSTITNPQMAREIHTSVSNPRTVVTAIKQLRDEGLLRVQRRPSHPLYDTTGRTLIPLALEDTFTEEEWEAGSNVAVATLDQLREFIASDAAAHLDADALRQVVAGIVKGEVVR